MRSQFSRSLPLGDRHQPMPVHFANICLLTALSVLTGCGSGDDGPKLTNVTGTVTIDGEPATSGTVAFAPVDGLGNTATGTVDSDGQFEMSTHRPGDGVAPGKYKVGISIVDTPAHGDADGTLHAATYRTPEKYMNPELSGLVVEIEDKASQTVTFEVDLPEQ